MSFNSQHYALIDLHLHLDGSLSTEWIIEWAERQQISLPSRDIETLRQSISAPEDCADLNQYLRCFALPISLLQTPEALQSAVEDLIKRLDQAQMLYAEIRFAPQFHTQQTMNQEEAVQAALRGLEFIKACQSLFKVNLILCCMRGEHNHAENDETIRLAQQYLVREEGKYGVVAVDLAGAEGLYPTSQFQAMFETARLHQVPFTLHAGEAAGAESVQQALDFGAARIGHGVRAIESEQVVSQLIEKRIPLEMCPCSNLQTKTVKQLADYPLRAYLARKVVATINTDNMTVSNTTIAQEFSLLKNVYQLSQQEAKQLVNNAVQAAFLSENEKKILWQKVQIRLSN